MIGIDASRITVDRLTGTETYTYQILRALASLAQTDPIELYLNAACPPNGMGLPGVARCIPFPRLWTHLRLSLEMLNRRPGVLFVPAHVVPIVHPRTVVTIHDLGYLRVPDAHPPKQRRMLDVSTRWSVNAACKVIAISEATKTDLINYYGVPADKIVVIHHGVAPEFRPAPREAIDSVRAKYALPEQYVLSVGTVQPRKNYARLAVAISSLAIQGLDISLVIAGGPGWMAEGVAREIAQSGLGPRLRMLGYVDDCDLPALYSGATVYCQPSLHEGFGLPLLEAMACGVPVLAAKDSSLPEIGGQAALYADPLDTSDIARGLARLLDDSSLRTEYADLGEQRSKQFSWIRCADQSLELLKSVRDA